MSVLDTPSRAVAAPFRARAASEQPGMDVFIAAMPRAGTTLLANLLTVPGRHWLITEPGLTRGDMGEHVRQQALRFGLDISEDEWWAAGRDEPAQDRFRRVLAPRLAGTPWGVKEVNTAGRDELLARYRPARVLLAVRDIRDCAVSLLDKHAGLPVAQRDALWMHDRLLRAARSVVQLARQTEPGRLRVVHYERLVGDPAYRAALADWLGWELAGDPALTHDLFGRGQEAARHAGRIGTGSVNRGQDETRADFLAFTRQVEADCAEYQALFGYTQPRAERAPAGPPMRVIIGRQQREKILSLLRPGTRMLEWGAGGSTVWLAQHLPPGARLTSVEHDPVWARQVQERIGGHPQVRLLLRAATGPLGANATIGEEDEAPLQSFVHAVEGEQFDVIFVDGNARHACLREARRLLAPGGTVLLHDAQRAWYDEAKQHFTAHGHIGSCPDYPSPHLWWGGLDEPRPDPAAAGAELPLVVCYYTQGTAYEDEARRLAASCERLGLPHQIVGLPSRGSWEANCSLKAEFIHEVWQRSGRPVLWVDADAVFHGLPELLRGTQADFAVHRCRGWQFASGTVFFNQTPQARVLLQRWLARCRQFPRVWDQDHLDMAWEETVATHPLQTLWLPESYCRIFDLHEGRSPGAAVIEHFQASRRLKDAVSDGRQASLAPVPVSAEHQAARAAARQRAALLSTADGATVAEPAATRSLLPVLVNGLRSALPAPARVLLLATGQGVLWRLVSEAGYEVHTVTDQAEVLADAQQFAPGRVRLGSPLQTFHPDAHFDAACCQGVLEFLSDDEVARCLAELRRVVRGPLCVAIQTGPDFERRWPLPTVRDAAWWQARFQAAGFAPGDEPWLQPGGPVQAAAAAADAGLLHWVLRPQAAAAAAIAPAAPLLVQAVTQALQATLQPHAELLVWGEAALVQAAGLDRLAPGARVWAASPWQAQAGGAPAPGAAWQQVLVLADGRLPGAQALQHLFLRLCDGGAQRVTLLVLPGARPAGELRHAIEAEAYAMGFRKSPHYYQAVDYEALHQEQGLAVIALERVPDAAVLAYPLRALSEERDLHMDMLREVGERSDAHVIRYQLAAALIEPGDHVLDSACGLGYGSHLLARLSDCASVLGVDGSDYAVRYAQMNFGAVEPRLSFEKAWLPQDLARLADRRFDVIVSFETLEHIADPEGLLAQFNRLLRPGGRIIVSVPNDWADETGEDPNPHHLHVYTLDKLRTQFERQFEAGALFQQIASGCKAQARGRQWTPMPRTLRPVALDTAQPPDAEWWIMAGGNPRPTRHAAPAPQADTGTPVTQALVLAMNCTPEEADPTVAAFWGQLNEQLAAQGRQLVIASTTPLSNPALQVLELPFELPAFAERFPLPEGSEPQLPAALQDDLVRWYRCAPEQAARGWHQARAFFEDLIETLRPAAVLGWQSANPVTRVLRACARAADVPFWAGERGWLRQTLMFDTLENNALGEFNLSLGLARLRASHVPAPATVQRLAARAASAADLARYPGDPRVTGAELRARLGIPAGDTVVAFFTHGEPGIGNWQAGPLGQLHDMPAGTLQARLDAVAAELHARGIWLLVQEHPFNRATCRTLALPEAPRVLAVAENVSSLVDAADFCLFTQATLQFDLACAGHKPFGLLARSPLHRDGTPPLYSEHAGAAEFLDSVMDRAAWPARREQLQRDIAFLYEALLLDVAPDAVAGSAARWAEHLAPLVRPLDSGFDERVGRFLARWGGAAGA